VDVDIFEERLHKGDVLLLCSDGLWEMVHDPNDIAAMACNAPTPLDACRALIAAANAAGGADNISVIVARVE
jgi:protein phosphatase